MKNTLYRKLLYVISMVLLSLVACCCSGRRKAYSECT
jgi:hypothetical protein